MGLQVDNKDWQFLAMRLGRGYLTIALHELGGDVLIDTKIDIHEIDQDDLLARLLHEIGEFFQTYTEQLGRVTSIAVTLPVWSMLKKVLSCKCLTTMLRICS